MAIGALVGFPGLSRAADAAAGFPEIEQHGVEGCGSESEIRARVQRWLGPDSSAEGWRAVLRVGQQQPGVYEVRLQIVGRGGPSRRTLVVDSCEAVNEASALLLLLAIDPLKAADVAEAHPLPRIQSEDALSPSEPPATPTTPGATTSTKPALAGPAETEALTPEERNSAKSTSQDSSEVRPTTPERLAVSGSPPIADSSEAQSLHFAVAGHGLLAFHANEFSQLAYGVGLELEVRLARWSLAAQGQWVLPTESEIPSAPGTQLRLRPWLGQLRTGYRFGRKQLRYGPYLGLDGRQVLAEGVALQLPGGSVRTGWWGISAGARLEWQVSDNMRFFGLLGGGLVLDRARFEITGVGEVFRPPLLTLTGQIGISWLSESQ